LPLTFEPFPGSVKKTVGIGIACMCAARLSWACGATASVITLPIKLTYRLRCPLLRLVESLGHVRGGKPFRGLSPYTCPWLSCHGLTGLHTFLAAWVACGVGFPRPPSGTCRSGAVRKLSA